MLQNRDELESWDREHLIHPNTHYGAHARGESPARMFETAEGVYVIDRDGKRSLDGFAGLYCVNIGYGRREVVDAIAAQARKLAYYHAYTGYSTEASVRLAHMVIERAPRNMSRVYFGLSGSDANETQIKLVWYYNNVLGRPQKKKIISRWRAYHGSGLMTGSLTGLGGFHAAFDLPFPTVLHTDAPYYYRRQDAAQSEAAFAQQCADNLDALIRHEGPDTVAAFIGEPMLGTGGIIPPPADYWRKIQAVLRKHDVLLIADEVVTGFGRLGSMFGSSHYGIEPDLISIAKGLTSAYAPLSGVIVSEDVWRVLEEGNDTLGPMAHGWTYSAHPLCAAAGIANLEVIDKEGLVENAREVGAYFQRCLHEAFEDHAVVGEVRGEGLLGALEFVADKQSRTDFSADLKVTARIAAACAERGLIARAMPQAEILGFAPPLCISRAEVDELVGITAQAVELVGKEVGA